MYLITYIKKIKIIYILRALIDLILFNISLKLFIFVIFIILYFYQYSFDYKWIKYVDIICFILFSYPHFLFL